MDGKPEYAIAGTWAEFYEWLQRNPDREVHYLTKARAELYVRKGMPKGTLHRIGTWEASSARQGLRGSRGEGMGRNLTAG